MRISNFLSILFTLLFVSPSISSAKNYKFTDFQLKDLRQMESILNKHIEESERILDNEDLSEQVAETQAIAELREALKILFSRPDKDNMTNKLLPDLRRKLVELKSFEDSLSQLTVEALVGFKQEKLGKTYRSTFLFILENVLAEVKPIREDNDLYKQILVKIKNAKIKVPRDVRSFRLMRGMYKSPSPSDIAGRILEKWEKNAKSKPKKNSKKKS